MALNPHFGLAAREAAIDNALNLANSGELIIYSGTQPATCDTALSGNTVLATFTLPATAFAAATGSSGATVTKTANAITAVTAAATGTATWFRIYKSDDLTGVADGSVGTSSADMTMATVSIVSGAQVSISSLVYSFAA